MENVELLGRTVTAVAAAGFLATLTEALVEHYFGPLVQALVRAIGQARRRPVETSKVLPYGGQA